VPFYLRTALLRPVELSVDILVRFDSISTGLKKFIIGKGQAENGLEEALLMMKYGDKARLILPPHLAFGLLGDDKKIPRRAIIVYEIEVVD